MRANNITSSHQCEDTEARSERKTTWASPKLLRRTCALVSESCAAGRCSRQAQAAIRLFANQGDRPPGDDFANRSAIILPIQDARSWPGFREAIVRFLILLQCSVACVLLIACANVANLMLEHASARRQEMDVRLALGASRGRLISLFLTEGLLIAALGTAAGLVVAVFTRNLLTRFGLPFRIRLNIEAAVDWRVLGFALSR